MVIPKKLTDAVSKGSFYMGSCKCPGGWGHTHTEHTNFPEQNINKPPAQNHDTGFTCTNRGIWKPLKFSVTLLKLTMYTFDGGVKKCLVH